MSDEQAREVYAHAGLGASVTLGSRVTIDGLSGVAVDLDTDGALLVDHGSGPRRVVAGELGEEVGGAAGD